MKKIYYEFKKDKLFPFILPCRIRESRYCLTVAVSHRFFGGTCIPFFSILQNINYSGKKTWSNFVANLLHPNCDLSNITWCPIRLLLFNAKLSNYLLQHLLKIKNLIFTFFILTLLRRTYKQGIKKSQF